jgi:hypothetical protein
MQEVSCLSFSDDYFRFHIIRLVKAKLEGLAGALKADIGAGTIFFSFLST